MVSLHAFVLAAALAGSNDLVLLDFGADWCAPCRSMEPTLQRLEGAGYPVRRVNIDKSPELAQRFAVGPIPCFVLVQNGREVQRMVGATSYDRLAQMFHQAGHGNASPPSSAVRGQSPDHMTQPRTQTPQPRIVPITESLAGGGRAAGGYGQMPPQAMAAPPSATSLASPGSTQAHRLALQATVRLRVTDPTGHSKGTGTIIDVHGNEALVLTCGHIFRDSKGKGEIEVELFASGTRGPLPGHLLVYECDRRDFALVSMRTDVSVTPVKVATTTYHSQKGEPIFSVGCDHGADPTVRVSTVSAIDRYTGPPNIEVQAHPVHGRSGGGLFTSDGRIIGICNAADLDEDRGIYAALPTIYLALDKIGQRGIYLNQPATALTDSAQPLLAPRMQPGLQPEAGLPPTRPALNPAAHSVLPDATALSEVLCIVRAPDGTSRVIVVKNPSPELLRQMTAESQQQALPARQEPAQGGRIARLSDLPSSSGPVVRAQGY